jgi:hypothetical protein
VLSGRNDLLDAVEMPELLEHLCNTVKKKWDISCTYNVQPADAPLEDIVSKAADKQSLIVAGTNGADDFFQRIFGATAVNIAWHAFSHVLLVPEEVPYAPVRNITFAWDYRDKNPLIREMRHFARQFDSQLQLVHISRHASALSKDVFHAHSELIKELSGDSKVSFRRIYSSNIREALDNAMHDYHSNMLALSLHNGRLIHRMFRNVKGKYALPPYPVLIVHPKVPWELVF